jgi:hypothetical protein
MSLALLDAPSVRGAAPPNVQRVSARPFASLCVLALLFTVLNCLKPLHMDDDAYTAFAVHIAERPLSPYDFTIYWGFTERPANEVLAPPVALYWLAGAIKLFGHRVMLWKLAFLPFHLGLCLSLHALLRRWSASVALPITWVLMLSPGLLPAANLMLDLPALTLGSGALAIFLHADDRRSVPIAILAGVMAGLAMQTKYTTLTLPVVFLAWGMTHRSLGNAFVAIGASALVFVGWEAFVAQQQGASHFLTAVNRRNDHAIHHLRALAQSTVALVPALSPGLLLAAIAGIFRSGYALAVTSLALACGFLAIGVMPQAMTELPWSIDHKQTPLKIDNLIYFALTITWWSAWYVAVRRGWRAGSMRTVNVEPNQQSRAVRVGRPFIWFALSWMILEFAGAVVLSPFPASRRVLGVSVVAAVLLAAALEQLAPPRRLVWSAAWCGAAFGIAVALIDVHEATAVQVTAARAAAIAEDQAGEGRIWFHGIWGFQCFCIERGLAPMVPNKSILKRGDYVILADQPLEQLDFRPAEEPLTIVGVVQWLDDLPWQAAPCLYSGAAPLRHQNGPRIRATVYRVTGDFTPTIHGTRPGLD